MGLTRRRFLLAAGAAGLAGLSSAAAWSVARGRAAARTGAASPALLLPVQQSGFALGTKVSLLTLHADRAAASAALRAAFAELDRVEDLMSLYRPHSQLCQLNRTGALRDPHPDLVAVLTYARQLAQRTGGAFDVTVQPLWELYATAAKEHRLPEAAAIAAARQRIGWRDLDVAPQRIALRRPGMAVTLNGVAQGFAADRVAAVLRQHGITHALIDTGEVGTLGRKDRDQSWQAGIQHPRQPEAYVALAQLAEAPGGAALQGETAAPPAAARPFRCLATSGDYATPFAPDFSENHIFDPATGHSPRTFASVSVAAPTALEADGLSTALFVLGPDQGRALLEATPGTAALLVLKVGAVLTTPGFPVVA